MLSYAGSKASRIAGKGAASVHFPRRIEAQTEIFYVASITNLLHVRLYEL
jgi:hypothetical protein